MNKILLSLHVALVMTVVLPVFKPNYSNTRLLRLPWRDSSRETWSDYVPLEEASKILEGKRYFLRSVVAAGVPALLAFLNLPLIWRLRGEYGDRWKAYSSLVLGLLSTSILSQLLARYGYGRDWGGWVTWSLSLILMIAGVAAVARLRTSGSRLPVIRDA